MTKNKFNEKEKFDRMDKKTKRTCTYKTNLIFVKFLERFKCYFFLRISNLKKIFIFCKNTNTIFTLCWAICSMNIYGRCGTRKFLNSREVYVSIRVSKYIAILDRSLTSKINTKRYMCVKN